MTTDELLFLFSLLGKEKVFDARLKALSGLTKEEVTATGYLLGGKLNITVIFDERIHTTANPSPKDTTAQQASDKE